LFLARGIEVAYYLPVSSGFESLCPTRRKIMIKRNLIVGAALFGTFAVSAIAFPQEPHVNVGERHGNMRAAQQLIQQAWQKVDEAQKDNHYNLGGHAAKAKELLAQASEEIKLSAEDANSHR
jgi:hypothetical protein